MRDAQHDTPQSKIVRKDTITSLTTKPMKPLRPVTREILQTIRRHKPTRIPSTTLTGVKTRFTASHRDIRTLGQIQFILLEDGKDRETVCKLVGFERRAQMDMGFAAACVLDDSTVLRTIGDVLISASQSSPTPVKADVACIPGAIVLVVEGEQKIPRGSPSEVFNQILSRVHVYIETGLTQHERLRAFHDATRLGSAIVETLRVGHSISQGFTPESEWSDAPDRLRLSLDLHTE
jgi:hypothetical protein